MTYSAIGIESHVGVMRLIIKDPQLAARQEIIVNKFNSQDYTEANRIATQAFNEVAFSKDGRPGVFDMLNETKFTTLIFLLIYKIENSYKSGDYEEARKLWKELKAIFSRPDLGKILNSIYGFKCTAKLNSVFNKYDMSLSKEVAEIHLLIIAS